VRIYIKAAAFFVFTSLFVVCANNTPPEPAVRTVWPQWNSFAEAFIQDDGRVVDWTAQARTVSEAQAYGLFFALVANDRPRFQKILAWTETNLAMSSLRRHLPAWWWGQDESGHWKILDPNSASDADLWLAYDLFEAGRLWREPEYVETAHAILRQVVDTEVSDANGKMLLPGPFGFETASEQRLNPSYLVLFQLDYFAKADPRGPWRAIRDRFIQLLPELAPSGCVPDWFLLTSDGPRMDSESDGRGSYDAVRVYLWAGIGPAGTEEDRRMIKVLRPFADFIRQLGRQPEHCFVDGRVPQGQAPAGMEAALLPFFVRVGAVDLQQSAERRIANATSAGLIGKPAHYYEQALNLFAQGWLEHRYSIDRNSRLVPEWQN
jgi:endoglucanase